MINADISICLERALNKVTQKRFGLPLCKYACMDVPKCSICVHACISE